MSGFFFEDPILKILLNDLRFRNISNLMSSYIQTTKKRIQWTTSCITSERKIVTQKSYYQKEYSGTKEENMTLVTLPRSFKIKSALI